MYVNDLIVQFRFGCKTCRALRRLSAYAHDMTLTSPSVSGLRAMLSTCERFVDDSLLKLNFQKSAVTVFSRRRSVLHDRPQLLTRVMFFLPVTDSFSHNREDLTAVENNEQRSFRQQQMLPWEKCADCVERRSLEDNGRPSLVPRFIVWMSSTEVGHNIY